MPSPNFGERKDGRRPDMIVLHYTGMLDAAAALDRLRTPASQVSSHYFVFEDGRVIQMVQESKRAWHAGVALWAGETDINSCSIGIEIANPGHEFGYRDFPKRQIAAVTALCRGILTRNTIPSARVLGHSDVAPARKQDPGEKFPWRILHDSGVGHWVKPAKITDGPLQALGDRGDAVAADAAVARRIRLWDRGKRHLQFHHPRSGDGVPAAFSPRAHRRRLRRIDPGHLAGFDRPPEPAAHRGGAGH